VLATRPTTEGEFFARPFEAAGIELVRPEEPDGAFVHEVYFEELVKGRFTNETRTRLIDVIDRMKTRHDIDAVILGGTELPLILREPTYADVPVLDATGVHVEAAVDWLVGD
jgi:aspartate racemase